MVVKPARILFLLFISYGNTSNPMHHCSANWQNSLPDRLITTGVITMIAAPVLTVASALLVRLCPTKIEDWYCKKDIGVKTFSSLFRASCLPCILGGTLMLQSQAPLEGKLLGAMALASGLVSMYVDFSFNNLWAFPNTTSSHVLRSMLKDNGIAYMGGGLLSCILSR